MELKLPASVPKDRGRDQKAPSRIDSELLTIEISNSQPTAHCTPNKFTMSQHEGNNRSHSSPFMNGPNTTLPIAGTISKVDANMDTTTSDASPPRRFIFDEKDMAAFKTSQSKRELVRMVRAMGQSCATVTPGYANYDPQMPLQGLNPSMASLHGSLRNIQGWLQDTPPDDNAKARFGNPAFRLWHARLVQRSRSIVKSILVCHKKYASAEQYDDEVLEQCSNDGFHAASLENYNNTSDQKSGNDGEDGSDEETIITELVTYLHDSFGHPTRLDYGTGHESSFFVFLYSLCMIGCFGSTTDKEPPTPARLKAITLSITTQYLKVTRGLQTDYMLEPAGSHGVWGLDDYHCLPFYFGACQLMTNGQNNNDDEYKPNAIHDSSLLEQMAETYMYFGCILYIKNLKQGVPFFESSPMLNDISHLPSWKKVSEGLLRLYEGEVLDKRQVVQHFVFGKIFKASWNTSHEPKVAPRHHFVNQEVGDVPGGVCCKAPWAVQGRGPQPPSMPQASQPPDSGGVPPPTRAPWAK